MGARRWPIAVTTVAIAARLAVAVVLFVGPWTDDPDELRGWDAERFQEIVDDDRKPWAEHPVEYPPGSVVVLELLAGGNVVDTNRALVGVSLVVDLSVAIMLWRRLDTATAQRYLILGLPLLPMGFLRLDTIVSAAAISSALVLTEHHQRHRAAEHIGHNQARPWLRSAGFGLLVAVGTMIKVWPALVVAGAMGIGRRLAAATAVASTAILGLTWLVWADTGFDPIDQVGSLRGTTGWHIESLPGSVLALFSDAEPRFELNAFRIGTVNQQLVLLGRIIAVTITLALASLAASNRRRSAVHGSDQPEADLDRLAVVTLGATAALLVTAPLLSPQFVLWLIPFAAVAGRGRPATDPTVVLVATAAVLTGATLAVFGPPNLAEPIPAALLVIRNLILVAIPVSCGRRLRKKPAEAPERLPKSPTSGVVDR